MFLKDLCVGQTALFLGGDDAWVTGNLRFVRLMNGVSSLW